MPQGRVILKRVSESRKLAQLSTDGARLLFTWLISHADINGCFSASPDVIKGQVFTRLRKSRATIENYLNELASVGLILLYENDGDTYLQINQFEAMQPKLNPDREGKTAISPPTQEQLQSNSAVTHTQYKYKLSISKDKTKQKTGYTPEFVSFWKKYPRRWNRSSDRFYKPGKYEAFMIWEKLPAGDQEQALYAVSKMRDGEFVKDCHRWLKLRRFDDFEKPTPKPPTSAPQAVEQPIQRRPVKPPTMNRVPAAKPSQKEIQQRKHEQIKQLGARK